MTTGTFTVSAAEASAGKNIEVGFEPTYVKVINENTASIYEYVAGNGIKIVDSGAGATDISTEDTVITVGTVGTGTSAYYGITLAAAALNENDVVNYVYER